MELQKLLKLLDEGDRVLDCGKVLKNSVDAVYTMIQAGKFDLAMQIVNSIDETNAKFKEEVENFKRAYSHDTN